MRNSNHTLPFCCTKNGKGFGACTLTGACEAVCPKEISISNIARLNKEYIAAALTSDK